ncbi:hypothetical protein CUJ83_11025 [Methanocella sp. CWC-04]|uniref:Flavodoxin domain-containing protein n=1 Tax=Methanooceanicella nereidis TaxID=2052831 RepID=A0AAP2RDD5_9EURY|nr:flavodoxin domain-containing protein [Methanocella sp. CWC-04]MCD1295531.1 hypothetical protein [Methanocella sp. CWC-04]
MDIKKILLAAGSVLILAVVAVFAVLGFVIFDVMSYTATGSETINPAGDVTGKALVVYDPGISGSAKNIAETVANDLKSNGYVVDLSGIRSQTAADQSGYDVIVVGGPIYAGNASSAVREYLASMKPSENAKIGVFATGSVSISDAGQLQKEAAPLPDDSPIMIDAVVKLIPQDDTDSKCAVFVTTLLQ